LDGFVADSAGGADRVFRLVHQAAAGPESREGPSESGASARRVIVAGRRTFEQAEGWAGHHPPRRR